MLLSTKGLKPYHAKLKWFLCAPHRARLLHVYPASATANNQRSLMPHVAMPVILAPRLPKT
eukprot:364535-Chlamydomonas_euryale.AAC.5